MQVQSSSFRQWVLDQFNWNQIQDMAEHGVHSGLPGLSGLAQTTQLYEQFEDEVWEMLEDISEENGFDDVITYLNAMNAEGMITTPGQFKQLCVWLVAQEYAAGVVKVGENA